MFFYSEPFIFITQVLCFHKFASSFYEVTFIDGTYLSIDLYECHEVLLR